MVTHTSIGTWNTSLLDDKEFAQELHLHLQSIGKYVSAMDIVRYVDQPEIKTHLKLSKTISMVTAQHWMKTIGYRWTKTPTGQFVDGHERDDVVAYQQHVFLPI
jgi:formate-dependent phosphoribosylglycinamide formyltransferase (GAR transformylase)